jgi:hypothetical protein
VRCHQLDVRCSLRMDSDRPDGKGDKMSCVPPTRTKAAGLQGHRGLTPGMCQAALPLVQVIPFQWGNSSRTQCPT